MSSLPSFSQGLGIGGRFGITTSTFSNWSKLLSDDKVDASVLHPSKVGLQASFVLNPMFSKSLGMVIELNFEQKGYTLKSDYTNEAGKKVDTKISTTYNYLTIPILFKGGYSHKVFSVYGFFGPYVSIAIGGKERYYENNSLDEEYIVEFGQGEISDDAGKTGGPRYIYKASRIDVGLTVGVQPGVRLGPGDLVLDIRYNFGFLGLDNPTAGQKSEYNEYASDNDMLPYYGICNRSFGISIGYIFRLGGAGK